MSAEIVDRLAMEAQIRAALARGEFQLHYQPKVELATGRVVGAEALVRWPHPSQGPIAPGRFVPVVGHGVQSWMGQVGGRVESPLTLLREYVVALSRLLAGETVKMARYDFKTGKSAPNGGAELSLKQGDLLLMEGIHGLNPALADNRAWVGRDITASGRATGCAVQLSLPHCERGCARAVFIPAVRRGIILSIPSLCRG